MAAFFETPQGAALLRRIFVAAVVTLTLIAPAGVRVVALFLKLASLDRYVACSYSAVRRAVQKIERDVIVYGDQERARLAATMAPKKITLALDETFHPKICLVGIEPVSGFILAEEYAATRDQLQWAMTLGAAKDGLNVEIVQATSDEARGIVSLVEQEMGHHSPDVFHVQREICKGTAAPLAAAVRRADAALSAAREEHATIVLEKDVYWGGARGAGRPPAFDDRIAHAKVIEESADRALVVAKEHRHAMRDVVKGIAGAYHPVDLASGAARAASVVAADLDGLFQRARELVVSASLPERCTKAVEKAARVMGAMVATISFFHRVVDERIAALAAPDDVKDLVLRALVASLYLARAAGKASTAEARARIQAVSRSLREFVEGAAAWLALDRAVRDSLLKVAVDCADLFQRSSSCVEGRNGRLSLHHHGLHALSTTKLKALTVVHNYFLTRSDETTAAERFFGSPPADLFTWLVERVDGPPRPAAQRRKPAASAG